MKYKILKEIHNGQNAAFNKNCIENNYAFDVVVDGTKYEISPCRLAGYFYGGEAYSSGMNESEMPQFTADEIRNFSKK